jgi:hypothetical protein
MVKVYVDVERSTELCLQYMKELFDSNLTRPVSDPFEIEEAMGKIQALIHGAATISAGICGGSLDDVRVIAEVMNEVVNNYCILQGCEYLSKPGT